MKKLKKKANKAVGKNNTNSNNLKPASRKASKLKRVSAHEYIYEALSKLETPAAPKN
jgi:hypothetical protein